MKIAINRCYGGFGVSKAIYEELGIEWDGFGYPDNKTFGIESDDWHAYRAEPRLIAAIEKIGIDKASGDLANLEVVDIPDGIQWFIDEYDGIESVHEEHRSW